MIQSFLKFNVSFYIKYKTILFLLVLIFSSSFLSVAYASLQWVPQGNTNILRESHQAVLLNNGKVMIAGGVYIASSTKVTEIFTPSTSSTAGNWVLAKPMIHDRKSFVLNVITDSLRSGNVKVLAAGGASEGCSCIRNTAELYDPSANIWVLTPNMIEAKYAQKSSVVDSTKVLVTGGIGGGGTYISNSVEMYDSEINQWLVRSSMNIERLNHQQVTFVDSDGKTKVLVMGGLKTTGVGVPISSTEIYDPSTDKWVYGPDMNRARFNFSAVLLHDGRVLAVGGNSAGDSEAYDPVAKQWKLYQTSHIFYQGATALLGENASYNVLAAGAGLLGLNSSSMLFNPQTNRWEDTEFMNVGRNGFTLTALGNGSALAVNGMMDSGQQTQTSELYTPPSVLGASVTPAPSPIPSVSPSLSPTPVPFLDLPWDYQAKGMNFNDSALAINTYFDHSYPLLSSGISEPATASANKISFRNADEADGYSSHDGYDYGLGARVNDGDDVLAAASGSATVILEKDSYGAGNVVKIDHRNGYQTWYEHLYPTGLASGEVKKGDKIGKVGHFGNCYVLSSKGNKIYNTPSCAHIHFGVFQDKNNDGNFGDNVPDGVTDPFGWQPAIKKADRVPDPWEIYTFLQNGIEKKGNISNYLWINKIDGVTNILTSSGGSFTVGKNTVELSPEPSLKDLTLYAQSEPSAKLSDNVLGVGPGLEVVLKDAFGKLVTALNKPSLRITIGFTPDQVYRFKNGTLSIYSSVDLKTWKKEDTAIDFVTDKATIQVDHLTHFALMGDRADTTAPVTQVNPEGDKGDNDWFKSNIKLSLNAQDNDGGLGVRSTFYKTNDSDWQKYTAPLSFNDEGKYKISFYSEDNDSHIEDIKTYSFSIDKIAPVTSPGVAGTKGDQGWYVSDVDVFLVASDNASGVSKSEYSLDGGSSYLDYTGQFKISKEGLSEILYRSVDKAGNIEVAKKLSINIDKTPPSTIIYTTGSKGLNDWYRTNVQIEFNGYDKLSGYNTTYYSLDNQDNFVEYLTPLIFNQEGVSKVYYYSVDKAGNKEDTNVLYIKIDKTQPVVTISANPSSIWPPNGKLIDVRITGNIQENNLYKSAFKVTDEYGSVQPVLTGFNQIIKLEAKRNGNDKDGRQYVIQATAEDMAGNKSSSETKIVVLHDKSN